MVNVVKDTLNISATCGNDVAVNTNTSFQGKVDYHLINSGDEDGYVSILITLSDSAGNNTSFSSNLQVISAKGDFRDSQQLFLNASYTAAGQITVTMQIQLTGALTLTQSSQCSFNVTAPSTGGAAADGGTGDGGTGDGGAGSGGTGNGGTSGGGTGDAGTGNGGTSGGGTGDGGTSAPPSS